jgi:hypothetical protein
VTVRETAVPELLDTPASQHVFGQSPTTAGNQVRGPSGQVPENRSIYIQHGEQDRGRCIAPPLSAALSPRRSEHAPQACLCPCCSA